MLTIDTRGRLCPEPLIMARNGLKEINEGDKAQVISDNETSYHNLMSFLSDLGANPVDRQEGNEFFIEVTKPKESEVATEKQAEDYCAIPGSEVASNQYVVVARSSKMGEGDEELGSLLIRGYFNALKGMENLPTHIIMYNGGVNLALKDTDTADALTELEDKGVSVIVCGTCVDYYNIKEQVQAGRISNMYQIATVLAEAGHVVYL